MRYDLHSHSIASDGALAPADLVARARAAGVDVLALTDHDTTAGLAEARVAASEHGVELVPGVEISVTWRRHTIHVVGLNVDAGDPTLAHGLARLHGRRVERAAEIARRLERGGVADAWAGARRWAPGPAMGRPHFARMLVEGGHARDMRQVFKRWLTPGRPGYVRGEWAALEEAVEWIRAAGGQAVIAHPARYRLTATRLRELLREFVESGGEGIEVVCCGHSREEAAAMAAQARRFGLWGSTGSDFHTPGNPWTDLGRLEPLPAGCRPVWESGRWGGAAPAAEARA